jgi:hypothetical protein
MTAERRQSDLAKLGIERKLKNGKQIVDRATSNEMKVLKEIAAVEEEPESQYILISSVGEEEVDRRTFASIWDAIDALVDRTVESLPSTREPAICLLTRYVSGFEIAILPKQSDDFEFTLRRFTVDKHGEPFSIEMDPEELRFASQVLAEKLCFSRPALVLNDSAVSSQLHPRCVARFNVTELETGIVFARFQEASLFQFFVWFECSSNKKNRASWIVRSKSRSFRIDVCWIDMSRPRCERLEIEEKFPEQVGDEIWHRYCDFLDALERPPALFKFAIRIVDGLDVEFDKRWLLVVDNNALSEAMHRQMTDTKRLAQAVGIPEFVLVGSQRLKGLQPETFVKLACLLHTEPATLVDTQMNRQRWVLATTTGTFKEVVSGATSCELSPSFGAHRQASSLLEEARDLGRRIVFEMKLGLTDTSSETIRDAVFDLLSKAQEAGVLLLLSRRILFGHSKDGRVSDGREYDNVVYFDAKPSEI